MEIKRFTLEWQKIHCGVLTEFGPTANGISSKMTSPAFISLVATKYLDNNDFRKYLLNFENHCPYIIFTL